MSYHLNRRASERLKALVLAGKYTSKTFSFSVADSNALLDSPPNWLEYQNWFLGYKDGVADPATDVGTQPTKDWFAYPFGKDGIVYLDALKQIQKQSGVPGDVAAVVTDALANAAQQDQDQAKAAACNIDISLSPLPVEIRAAADEQGQPKGPPTFDAVVYTGGAMSLTGFTHPVVVDMKGIDTTDKSRPVLKDHDTTKPVGHTSEFSNNGKDLFGAKGVVSGGGPHTAEVKDAAKNNFPWQVSMGAKVLKNQFVPEGESDTANGKTWNGPINLARRTSVREISFLALGADDDTSAGIAAKAAGRTPMKFKSWAKAHGFKADEMDAAALKCAKAMYKAQFPDGDPDDDSEDEPTDKGEKVKKTDAGDAGLGIAASAASAHNALAAGANVREITGSVLTQIRAEVTAETKRIQSVRKICAGQHPDIEAKALEEGWDDSKTELAVLRASRPKPGAMGGFFINKGAGAEATPDIVAAAAALGGGVPEKFAFQVRTDSGFRELTAQQKEIATSRPMRGAKTIYGLFSIIAAANSTHLPDSHMTDDVIRAMLQMDKQMYIRADAVGGYSTMSLSGITENILNKSMFAAYSSVPSVVPQIAFETDTSNFQIFKRYRLTASGDFQLVSATGEIESMGLQDESYSNQVQTWAQILNITRQLMINDDMGALTQLPTIVGRKGAMARERALFTILTANASNFFGTGNKNYLSGTTSALGIGAMTSARQKFLEQKDAGGDPIMVMPDRVLVPPSLEENANSLHNGADLVVGQLAQPTATSGSAAAQGTVTSPNYNAHKNKYTPIVSPWLGAASPIAGGSDTGWYLLADPSSGTAVIQVGYLRGQRVPTIKTGEASLNTLGISVQAVYDFGVALADSRTGVFSAGV